MSAAADALMGIFGFKRVEGEDVKTDRELLELAARAAGLDLVFSEYHNACVSPSNPKADRARWNPLTDDGDALRLAVKLCLRIWTDGTGVVVESSGYPAHSHEYELAINNAGGIYSATRRAIVRAAAAIGEASK